MKRVRVGSYYVFKAVPFDIVNPPFSGIPDGSVVKVVNLKGCPKANTLGMCYIEHGGEFVGMVMTASLVPFKDKKGGKK
jgi:hypothetical protein